MGLFNETSDFCEHRSRGVQCGAALLRDAVRTPNRVGWLRPAQVLLGIAAGALALGLASPAVVRADTDAPAAVSSPSDEAVVDLNVTNANLMIVVESLRRQGNLQFFVAGDPKLFHPITAHLTLPLSKMLSYIGRSAGATITKDEFGIFTISPIDPNTPVAPPPAPVVKPETVNPTPAPPVDVPPAEPLRWETVNLQYVEPTFIMSVLREPDVPLLHNPYVLPQTSITTPPPSAMPLIELNPNGNNNAGNYNGGNPTPNSLTQPGVPLGGASNSVVPNVANFSATRVGDQAMQFPGPGGGAPGGGGAAGAAGAASLRPAGVDMIIAITEQNKLLVRGTSAGIAELRDLIAKLDVPAKQVQIKVEFVTASVAAIDQLGISFDLIPYPSVETGFFPPGPSGSGSTFLTFAHGNLVAKLAALLTTSQGKVIASPMITLTNNIQGNITVSEQIPYSQTTTIAQGSGNALTAQTTSFLDVTTGLGARARINGDNSVTLQLQPQLANVGAPPPSGPPPVSTQTINTIRTVGNGETLVLGGLVQKSDTNARTKFPYLADLPIIGNLFRSRNNSQSDSELLIFVTPTILPVPGSTTTGQEVAPIEEGLGVQVGVTP